MNITLTINNKAHDVEIKGNETLMEVLRNNLLMTGTKTACQESECGTCAVIINGKSVLSCITLAGTCAGQNIRTIEGLAASDEKLHPVQEAFVKHGSSQCGFCIPGMIMSATALLEKNPTPTHQEIEYALDGNICRCAGYPKIFEAVREAGIKMAEEKKA